VKPNFRFNIGINPLWPGEKLSMGDSRWTKHTASFYTEQHDLDSFVKRVTADGYAFSGVMKDSYRRKSKFISAQHLALDDDRGTYEASIDALSQDPFIAGYAAFIYETPSSTPENPKSRVVFVLNAPITDGKEYELAQAALLFKFGETDESVKEASRFFYGRPLASRRNLGNVLPQPILNKEVIEPFLDAQKRDKGHHASKVTSDVIPEKHRNTTLTSLAGTMRRRGASRSAIEAALLAENQARCDPPLDEQEVRRISSSIAGYSPTQVLSSVGQGGHESQPELQVISLASEG